MACLLPCADSGQPVRRRRAPPPDASVSAAAHFDDGRGPARRQPATPQRPGARVRPGDRYGFLPQHLGLQPARRVGCIPAPAVCHAGATPVRAHNRPAGRVHRLGVGPRRLWARPRNAGAPAAAPAHRIARDARQGDRPAVQEAAAKVDAAQGFKPGKKQRKEIREQVIDEMLPAAFRQQDDGLSGSTPTPVAWGSTAPQAGRVMPQSACCASPSTISRSSAYRFARPRPAQ